MARSGPKPQALPKYRTQAGTPNELEETTHATPALAKGWLETRMRTRKKWAERYSHKVRDELAPIIQVLDGLNLPVHRSGKEWEWRVVDDVSSVVFIYRLEIL